jgi:hypothetical protein
VTTRNAPLHERGTARGRSLFLILGKKNILVEGLDGPNQLETARENSFLAQATWPAVGRRRGRWQVKIDRDCPTGKIGKPQRSSFPIP